MLDKIGKKLKDDYIGFNGWVEEFPILANSAAIGVLVIFLVLQLIGKEYMVAGVTSALMLLHIGQLIYTIVKRKKEKQKKDRN